MKSAQFKHLYSQLDPRKIGASTQTILNHDLQKAVAAQDAGLVRELLADDADPNALGEFRPHTDELVLHVATRQKELDLDIVRTLLEFNADPNTQQFEKTPLYHVIRACTNNLLRSQQEVYIDAARLLVSYGADVNAEVRGGSYNHVEPVCRFSLTQDVFSAVSRTTYELLKEELAFLFEDVNTLQHMFDFAFGSPVASSVVIELEDGTAIGGAESAAAAATS